MSSALNDRDDHVQQSLAAGHLQTAINLLTPAIASFVQQTNPNAFAKKKPDFADVLKELITHSRSHKRLCRVAIRCQSIRHQVAHQSNTLHHYSRSIESLVHLAALINNRQIGEQIQQLAPRHKFQQQVGSQPSKIRTPLVDNNSSKSPRWVSLKVEGNEHFAAGRCTEAMTMYTRAIALESKQSILYSNRAISELKLKMYELARRDAEDAIELDPTNVKFYRLLSEALVELHLVEDAVAACNDGLTIDSGDQVLRKRLSDCNSTFAAMEQQRINQHIPSTLSLQTSREQKTGSDDDANSIFLQACKYEKGENGVPQDLQLATQEYERAAAMNHQGALLSLAQLQVGLLAHIRPGFTNMLKTARTGNVEAQSILARMYALGHGCDRNEDEARKWYNKSQSKSSAAQEEALTQLLSGGKLLCGVEDLYHLPFADLHVHDRIARFAEHLGTDLLQSNIYDDLDSILLGKPQIIRGTRSIIREGEGSNWLSLMQSRADQGSLIARSFFLSTEQTKIARKHMFDATIPASVQKLKRVYQAIKRSYHLFEATWALYHPDFLQKGLWKGAGVLLSKDPNHIDTIYVLGRIQSSDVSVEENIEWWKSIVDRHPNEADFNHQLSGWYGGAGDYQNSLRYIRRALEIDPRRVDFLYDFATALRLVAEEPFKVITAYQKYIDEHPHDARRIPEAYYCLGYQYCVLKQMDQARSCWIAGQKAEMPNVKLPCFPPVANDFSPKFLLKLHILIDERFL